MEPAAFFVASRPAHGEGELTVHHPYDGRPVGRTTLATPDQVEAAVAAASGVAAQAAALPRMPARRPWTMSPGGSPNAPRRSRR